MADFSSEKHGGSTGHRNSRHFLQFTVRMPRFTTEVLQVRVPSLAQFTKFECLISVKKEHNSVRAVLFEIFHNCPFDNFLSLKKSSNSKYLIQQLR